MDEAEAPPALLELRGISKSFGGVAALRDVDFALERGEIHGLVGENGAGKSTLMKIIAGVHTAYEGRMSLAGRELRLRNARDAREAGIGMVHQELSVVPTLTVAENVFLGSQPLTRLGTIDWAGMRREAARHLENLGIEADPGATLGTLPLGLQQLIELARVLFSGARIIILDEPTSALSPPEIERLFALLRRLCEGGRSIIFISHFLDDILAISDSVTVFRNGSHVASAAAASIDKAWLIENMIGRDHDDLAQSYVKPVMLASRPEAEVLLEAEGLSRAGAFRDVSLTVRAGEVLGIYGFLGSGQLELARSLFGHTPAERGTVRIGGRRVRLRTTSRARQAGLAFVPESRRSMLFAREPVYKNVSISILSHIGRVLLRPAIEREIAGARIADLGIRPPRAGIALGALSGGNQQKVALAKWLTRKPKVLILSEPTRGMDVGAKEDVVRIVRGLREEGIGIVVVSTEPETVLSLADRILVMKKGEIAREFASEAVGKNELLAAA
ncbi:MAG TPA: sugar ABC transporter ATP-binding protein [Acetobacteraceae bacterium]|nr:sugar ABC transporter ATP-binding protein [Acetobacteraceae bacterium]